MSLALITLPSTQKRPRATTTTVLQGWGIVEKRGANVYPRLRSYPRSMFAKHAAELPYLLVDAHRYWRRRHLEIRHDEEAQKAHNADWQLVKRSFKRNGVTLE